MMTKGFNNERDIVYLIILYGVKKCTDNFNPTFHIVDGQHVVLVYHLAIHRNHHYFVRLIK